MALLFLWGEATPTGSDYSPHVITSQGMANLFSGAGHFQVL